MPHEPTPAIAWRGPPRHLPRDLPRRAHGPEAVSAFHDGLGAVQVVSCHSAASLGWVVGVAPRALEAFRRKYEGTRLGKQELYAELLEEAEGALWTRALIEAACTRPTPPAADMKRIVIAVDPAVTAKAESDETGIVAAGVDAKRDGHVLRDISGRYSPEQWARRTVLLYDELKADRVVVEDNQGGDMVESVLRQVSPKLPIKRVHAHTGKAVRAEPVAALYEQRRVSHAPGLSDLEDQMCIWEPLSGQKSPDRLDALVYALRELMLGSQSDGPRIGRL